MFLKLATATGMAAIQQVAKSLATVSPKDVGQMAGAAVRADSLISYTSVARVEPITLVDADIQFSDLLPETMQSLLSIFSGYYLQAYALSTLSVGKVDVVKHLDRLNPNRSPGKILINQLGAESYKDRLPVVGDKRNEEVAMEDDSEVAVAQGLGKDAVKDVRELTNLSVGKLFNVEVTEGDNKAVIPVSIRLLVNSVPTQSLVHILSAGSKDRSFKERWYQYKAGNLELIRDLVLCQDLIDEHKKHLLDDKTGLYQSILNRRRDNALASAISGSGGVSLATASNIAVISSDTATKLEIELNGPLKNYAIRKKLFDAGYLMLLAVIDKQWDRVTFYHRGIPDSTSVSHRDMKAANKGSGPDVADILNAYRQGHAPTL